MKRSAGVLTALLFLGVSACGSNDPGFCTVDENSDGSATISCADGRSARISAPADGMDGSGCSVVDNMDDTFTVTCGDDAPVTLSNGAQGEQGEDGGSCSVADNGDGTKTISCADGTMATVEDGEQGMSGEACTIMDDGSGTATVMCPDGTSTTLDTCDNGQLRLSNVLFNGNSPDLSGTRGLPSNTNFELAFQWSATGTADCPDCDQVALVVFDGEDFSYPTTAAGCVELGAPKTCDIDTEMGEEVLSIRAPLYPGDYDVKVFHGIGKTCAELRTEVLEETIGVSGTPLGWVTVNPISTCSTGRKFVDNVRLNDMDTSRIKVAPGANVTMSARYNIARGGCSGCVEPMEVGYAGRELACPFTGVPRTCPGDSRDNTTTFAAPMTPGVYRIGFKTALVFNCGMINFNSVDERTTFAVVEVE